MIIAKKNLQESHKRIKSYVHRTPVLQSQLLNELTGASLYFKCENFQKMGAFKMRGASNAILQLSETEKEFGVATHSSGNFAQALALAAKMQGIKAYIVMPSNAPEIKKAAVRAYGGEIIECVPSLEARESCLDDVVNKTGAIFLHPYNDYDVIQGQATTAMELFEDYPNLDAVFAPVGGGGLLAGTALAAHYFSSKTKIVAGEPMGADDAWQSFEKGEIVPQTNPQTIADGLLTSLGDKTFPIIKEHVDKIIRVEEEEIIAAMRLIWERMKLVIEASSAVAFAALLKEKSRYQGQKIGVILSGGNVQLEKLPFQ